MNYFEIALTSEQLSISGEIMEQLLWRYLHGQLSEKEIEIVWVEMAKEPELLDYLELIVHLKVLSKY